MLSGIGVTPAQSEALRIIADHGPLAAGRGLFKRGMRNNLGTLTRILEHSR